MLQNKLFRVGQAYRLGFSTAITLSWKRFCLFCSFQTSLFIIGCLIQLVYTYFPSRVIDRPVRFADQSAVGTINRPLHWFDAYQTLHVKHWFDAYQTLHTKHRLFLISTLSLSS